ncbi:MAG TPA: VanZ family protein [Gammaproteobacteria bacterium]|nr:VanZ family protein [Gammaproteobacteria bacterium]
MLPLRYPWVWWLLGWLLVVGVIAGSLVPGDMLSGISVGDKILHAGSYFALMIWFSGLYRRERHIFIVLFLFVLGFALDYVQGSLLSRSFDIGDVAANTGGILIGFLLARYVLEGWCRRVEQLLLPQ